MEGITDDLVNNIMGDKDFTDMGNISPPDTSQSDNGSEIGSYQIFNANNQLVGFHCPRVMENNPDLVDIPLLFYIDLKYPIGKEFAAKRRVQSELLLAIARDFRITSGKACTDPPKNGNSWLVSIQSDGKQLTREETFPKCRELKFDDRTEECFVYQFELTGNVLTGKKMPDVEAVVETLFVNHVQNSIGSDFEVQFLGIPKYEDGADDQTINIPPSNLKDSDSNTTPINRSNVTIVGGFLVAAFCLATAAILLILYKRRKAQQLTELELEQTPKHLSHDTEDEDFDHEVPEEHLYPLDLGNSFNQQVLGAHTPNNNASKPGPTKYLTNVNPNQGPYSHFYGQQNQPQPKAVTHRRTNSGQSDHMSTSTVDSWAQTNATIGSLELQMQPIAGEI